MRGELARVGMERALMGGVFLTGARRQTARTSATWPSEMLQCQARFGLTDGIQDWPEEMNDPEWMYGGGLAMYSAKLKAAVASSSSEAAGWIGKMLK